MQNPDSQKPRRVTEIEKSPKASVTDIQKSLKSECLRSLEIRLMEADVLLPVGEGGPGGVVGAEVA